RVMVDSIFPATAIASLALLAWRPGGEDRPRPVVLDAAAGVMFGAAFLLRGGALPLVLPIVILAFNGQTPRRAWMGLARVFLSAALPASPFIVRDLRLFHTWYYSDVGAYGIWPYVDQLAFNAGLDRPPSPIGFMLTHLPQVARHWLESAARFSLHTFTEEVLGHQWVLPLAAGLLLGLRRFRDLAFAYLYAFATTAFIFAVHWGSRYFVTTTALECVFAGLGAAWLWRRLGPETVWRRVDMRPVLILLFALALLTQLNVARQWVRRAEPVEAGAPVALASDLHQRL